MKRLLRMSLLCALAVVVLNCQKAPAFTAGDYTITDQAAPPDAGAPPAFFRSNDTSSPMALREAPH